MSRYSAVDNDRSAGHCCFHAVNIVAIVLWSLLLCCCVAGAVAGTLLWLTADQRRRYDTRKLWTLYIALPGKPRFFPVSSSATTVGTTRWIQRIPWNAKACAAN